uniref:Cathepsin L n=1 Tax=Clastoptera arizonana TaxID=38151 RepID=A0A1B6CPV5_9HEMI
MKFLIPLAILIIVAEGVSFYDVILEEWSTFKLQHSKSYDSEMEDKFRLKIFMDNRNKIAKHNAKYEKKLVSYSLKINHFGDMLHHEFISTMNGFNRSKNAVSNSIPDIKPSYFIEPANVEVKSSVDWRENGAVTEIKDQGKCGSCWAFSTTGALEGQHYRKTKKLVSLSEQNLIDCSTKYGNNGCEGGLMDNAFRYIKDNHGIDTESTYPYEGMDDTCRYQPSMSGATDTGFVDIPSGNERKLKAAVASVGPISVAIDASNESFQFYNEGVYYEENCSSENLDHGVLVVGYGTTVDGDDYWIVKNSWGEKWGDKGYIKMARNRDNNCGIATSASYPLV